MFCRTELQLAPFQFVSFAGSEVRLAFTGAALPAGCDYEGDDGAAARANGRRFVMV